jgi:hypothetical protein
MLTLRKEDPAEVALDGLIAEVALYIEHVSSSTCGNAANYIYHDRCSGEVYSSGAQLFSVISWNNELNCALL